MYDTFALAAIIFVGLWKIARVLRNGLDEIADAIDEEVAS